MCRLAARELPLGGSSSGTQNECKNDVSPGGNSSPARRFLEKNLETQKSHE